MLAATALRNNTQRFSRLIFCNFFKRALHYYDCLAQDFSKSSLLPENASFSHFRQHRAFTSQLIYQRERAFPEFKSPPMKVMLIRRSSMFQPPTFKWVHARHINNASIELKTEEDVVRFSFGHSPVKGGSERKAKKATKKVKMSRKAKLNELRFYRLKAKKKMTSPNPEVRIRYKLEKARRKEAWLIEKLRTFEVPKAPVETYDPEILTEEEKFYLKRTGEKKKNYVPVGRRGVFGGVVLNMHLHWKKHETVKVICKPCRPGQIHQYAAELAQLSKGMVIDIKPDNTIIFYRGKNYVQPDVMSPPDTLSKAKTGTTVLQSFSLLSFVGNENLCGPPSLTPCNVKNDIISDNSSGNSSPPLLVPVLLVVIVVSVVILLFLFIIYFKKYKNLKEQMNKKNKLQGEEESKEEKNIEAGGEKRAAEGEDTGKLVFMNCERHFQVDDLLRASAEGLGKGNFGNCYRAMLEDGPTVVVKRLRDLKPLSKEEFMKQVRLIAEQKHPNLLPLLGYYHSKDEKLLLYKFASNGNAYNRLHDGKGKPARIPFKWRSRLKVARGVARALEHLHLNMKTPNMIPHGNLKLSNVLLDDIGSVLVSDYGLTSLVAVPVAVQRMNAYKSPEYQNHKRVSIKSDVWSYGCLLLELLTGRMSADSAPQGVNNAVDLCSWVHRAVREEWTAEIFDVEIAVQRSANHGMLKLLQVAIRCCEKSPEMRPEMGEVVREVENIAIVVDSESEEDLSSMDRSFADDSMSATPSISIGKDQR